MATQLNLEEFGIKTSENLIGKLSDPSLKMIGRKLDKTKRNLGELSVMQQEDEEEEKKIKEKMAQLCAKLIERKKEIKQQRKVIIEQRLLLIGEMKAYINELKESGIEVENKTFKEFIRGLAPKTIGRE